MLPLYRLTIIVLVVLAAAEHDAWAKGGLPRGFVYLRQTEPSIEQDMRYATIHNFTGARVPGYDTAECVLTEPTAIALKQAQKELNVFGLGIKVYDCYRPARAVDFFSRWATSGKDASMSREFFPNTKKQQLHSLGYIAHRSGHSRGSTVDLTLVPYPAVASKKFEPNEPLLPCTGSQQARFDDNSLDMGTGFDCLDEAAHTEWPNIPTEARRHRLLLRQVMRRYGLINYPKEWWHYTYYNEPFRNQIFDFNITQATPDRPAPQS